MQILENVHSLAKLLEILVGINVEQTVMKDHAQILHVTKRYVLCRILSYQTKLWVMHKILGVNESY